MPRSARLLFVGGAAMAVGSLAPWVTLFLLNISGVDAEYGIVTLLAGVVCSVAAYEVWKGGVFQQVGKKTVLVVALVAAIAGTASPIYVAAEAKRSVAGALGSGTRFGVPTAPGSSQFPSINNGL
jgi:branched-subunit amino acid transport protein AzlD